MSDSAAMPHPARPAWLPTWSVPAAVRAARATLVVPSVFAVTDKLLGNPQMTLFAVFGAFASLAPPGWPPPTRDSPTS